MTVIGLAQQEGDDPNAKLKSFRKAHNLTYRLAYDAKGAVIARFGFSGIPTSVVIDKNGKYVANPETMADAAKVVDKLLHSK